jgi:hypothetical protein
MTVLVTGATGLIASITTTTAVAPGFWTLLAATALAIAAAAVAWRQPRAEPERVKPDTPRLSNPCRGAAAGRATGPTEPDVTAATRATFVVTSPW